MSSLGSGFKTCSILPTHCPVSYLEDTFFFFYEVGTPASKAQVESSSIRSSMVYPMPSFTLPEPSLINSEKRKKNKQQIAHKHVLYLAVDYKPM